MLRRTLHISSSSAFIILRAPRVTERLHGDGVQARGQGKLAGITSCPLFFVLPSSRSAASFRALHASSSLRKSPNVQLRPYRGQ